VQLTPVVQNNKGFTLVEVMIAFLITMLGLLAVVNVAVMSIHTNMANMLRDEATRIADQRLNGRLQYTDASGNLVGAPAPGLQLLPYAQLVAAVAASQAAPVCGPAGNANAFVTSDIRGVRRSFSVCWQVTQTAANSNTFIARVWVGWNYKGGAAAGIAPTGKGYQIGVPRTITKLATD
jgi:type II secretory pathway pseudopilin PulG